MNHVFNITEEVIMMRFQNWW